MTNLLDCAITRTRALSLAMQIDMARVLLLHAGDTDSIIQLTPEAEANLTEAETEADPGQFAADEEAQAIFAKYRHRGVRYTRRTVNQISIYLLSQSPLGLLNNPVHQLNSKYGGNWRLTISAVS